MSMRATELLHGPGPWSIPGRTADVAGTTHALDGAGDLLSAHNVQFQLTPIQ